MTSNTTSAQLLPDLCPGFTNPVLDAQACFRALLDATAHPGRCVALRAPPSAPALLSPAMAAIALTLLDADTPVWLDEPTASGGAAAAWLRFHGGCRIEQTCSAAAFALINDAPSMPSLDSFCAGTDEYPDRAATLVIAVEGLGTGEALRLEGPGIDGSTIVQVAGLPQDFIAQRAANHRLFPRGVDMLLTAGAVALALPRSTRVAAYEGG